jgi:hypothetical protein
MIKFDGCSLASDATTTNTTRWTHPVFASLDHPLSLLRGKG